MPFCFFWSIFEEIQREILFLDLKEINSEMGIEILRKFAFLSMFEKDKFCEIVLFV